MNKNKKKKRRCKGFIVWHPDDKIIEELILSFINCLNTSVSKVELISIKYDPKFEKLDKKKRRPRHET